MLQNLPENISDRIPFVKDFIEKLRRCFPENFKKNLKRFFLYGTSLVAGFASFFFTIFILVTKCETARIGVLKMLK